MGDFKRVKIKDIATVIMGQSPASKFYNKTGDGLPFFQGVKDFGWKYPTETSYTTVAHKVAEKGDILFSVRAPVGDLNTEWFVKFNFPCSMHSVVETGFKPVSTDLVAQTEQTGFKPVSTRTVITTTENTLKQYEPLLRRQFNRKNSD